LIVGDLVMDCQTKEVLMNGRPIEILGKEYSILEYLMRHPNHLVTRTMIEQHVWSIDMNNNPNLVEVYISKLRAKLNIEGKDSMIQTVHRAGYRIKAI
jgi:two-component system OmpR family response regulator